MSNRTINDNSIWVNGIQKDSEGYAVFYPLGTNKVDIPKNSPHWPKGNKLIGQFVYDKNNKLVGFCDTKAMTSTKNGEIIVMPYEEIDTDFDSISNGDIQIHAPKATVKKASWNGGGEKVDIPDVQYKYKGCKTVDAIKTKDENYLENDIVDGKWTELLSDLTSGNNMFRENENITSFDSDLSSLNDGYCMFYNCRSIISFVADLNSLIDSDGMFEKCSNLTIFDSILNSLSNGYNMFNGCSALSSFNCNDLSSLINGYNMFCGCSSLTKFTSDLKTLTNGGSMFYNCTNLSSFDSDLSSLTAGTYMFINCSNLSNFVCNDLKSLTRGEFMFNGCSNLSTFNYDLSSLTHGRSMFNGCSNLSSFIGNLSNLDNGNSMFGGCINLVSFKNNLNSLTVGYSMFNGCKNLITFASHLKSLADGTYMFGGCKLDVPSIKNIIDTINTVESANLFLGMGCDNNAADKDLFAQEVGYTDMTTLLQTLQNKGWTVSAQFNGRPSSTFSLRKPESLPVFVKLVEVSPDEEFPFYEYTSIDGSKFFNLDWLHDTTGSTDGYDVFSSLEEAIAYFNIKQIEK